MITFIHAVDGCDEILMIFVILMIVEEGQRQRVISH